MGLLDDQTHQQYYQGNDLGNYQFTSLEDIINQFMVVYVGDQKIISKASRIDVAFHAQRAMQELSFDTFKSIKSQQIDIPASLTMILPHDYVNYTKISWADSAGIKHTLYPTSATSNPFQIRQEDSGEYNFPESVELIVNNDFSTTPIIAPWYIACPAGGVNTLTASTGGIGIDNEVLKFSYRTYDGWGTDNWGNAYAVWQAIDVSDLDYVDFSADGAAVNMTNGIGVLRFGLSTGPGDSNIKNFFHPTYMTNQSQNSNTNIFDLATADGTASYLEWTALATGSKEKLKVDVRSHDIIYTLVVSYMEFNGASSTVTTTNYIDDLSVVDHYASNSLQTKIGNEIESSTWNNYKSGTPSENQDDYQDDTYWPIDGSRFGLDPQHAQTNGSFYIDDISGKIHFSSNVSGKTVILDYISDSLGTDKEAQVHKFAEEAVYRYILHSIAAGRIQTQQLVPRLKKEKFAAIRQAKLRLSNIKLEEITQSLRGKSK